MAGASVYVALCGTHGFKEVILFVSDTNEKDLALPSQSLNKTQPAETGNPNSSTKGLMKPVSLLISITTRRLARVNAT